MATGLTASVPPPVQDGTSGQWRQSNALTMGRALSSEAYFDQWEAAWNPHCENMEMLKNRVENSIYSLALIRNSQQEIAATYDSYRQWLHWTLCLNAPDMTFEATSTGLQFGQGMTVQKLGRDGHLGKSNEVLYPPATPAPLLGINPHSSGMRMKISHADKARNLKLQCNGGAPCEAEFTPDANGVSLQLMENRDLHRSLHRITLPSRLAATATVVEDGEMHARTVVMKPAAEENGVSVALITLNPNDEEARGRYGAEFVVQEEVEGRIITSARTLHHYYRRDGKNGPFTASMPPGEFQKALRAMADDVKARGALAKAEMEWKLDAEATVALKAFQPEVEMLRRLEQREEVNEAERKMAEKALRKRIHDTYAPTLIKDQQERLLKRVADAIRQSVEQERRKEKPGEEEARHDVPEDLRAAYTQYQASASAGGTPGGMTFRAAEVNKESGVKV